MSEIFSTYAPIEVLLLFHHLAVNGITSSFAKVSDSLKAEPLVRNGHNYDANRLDPDALKDVFLKLLKEETRSELYKTTNDNDGEGSDGQAGRKRKATSPPLVSTADAIRDQHLIPQLVLKLYARYRDQAISEIREVEKRYVTLTKDLKEIEQGQWDARLQMEIKQGKWNQSAQKGALNGSAQRHLAQGSNLQTGPSASSVQARQSSASASTLQSLQPAPTVGTRDPRSKSPFPAQGQARPSPVDHPTVLIPQPYTTSIGQARPQSVVDTPSQHVSGRPSIPTPGTAQRPSMQYSPQLGTTAQSGSSQTRLGLPHGGSPVPPYPYSQPPTSSASIPGPYSTQPQRSTPVTPAAGVRTPNAQQSAMQYRDPRSQSQARGVIMQPFEVGPQMPRRSDQGPEAGSRPSQTGPTAHDREGGNAAGGLPSYNQVLGDKSRSKQPRVAASAKSTPNHVPEPNRRSTLPPQMIPQGIKNELVRLLGTPNSSRASSVASTPARTPWKTKPMETRVANHRSPPPMRERSISPIPIEPLSFADNSTMVNTPSTMADQKMDFEQSATKSAILTASTGRGGRGRGRGRGGRGSAMAGSRTSSVTGASTRGRTRSQSVMSQTSTNNDQRNVKAEPSTPADVSDMDFTRSMETPASDRKAKQPSQYLTNNPMKRKRALRGASEDTHDGVHRYPSSNIVVRPNEVLAVKNFPRLCASVLQNISTHKHASLFANPVRPKDAEGYTEIIKRPTDLKTIKSAISAGARAVTAATAELTAQAALGTPTSTGTDRRGSTIGTAIPPSLPIALSMSTSSSSREASTFILPISEDLIPPKGIVNSAQLEKELMRMLANAVMFNPGEEGVVADAREMHEDISREIAGFRSAERMGGVAERGRRGGGRNDEEDEEEGGEAEEGDDLGNEGEGSELRVSKRRRG